MRSRLAWRFGLYLPATVVVSLAVLWVASYPLHMVLGYRRSGLSAHVVAVDGEFSVRVATGPRVEPAETGVLISLHDPQVASMDYFLNRPSIYRGRETAGLGFGYVRAESGSDLTSVHRILWLPLWFPWLLATVLFAAAARRRLRVRRRRARGLCLRCGYDLRESPSRCPECGSDVSAPAAGAAPA